jgi:KipI family sensor histidine kinase inhibitor
MSQAATATRGEVKLRAAGDRYVLVELARTMDLESNFRAQGLATSLKDARIDGVVDVAPCFASVLIEYDCDRIALADLRREIEDMLGRLGATENLNLESRLINIPAVYLDPWTRAAIEQYSSTIKPRGYDPDGIAELNGLTDAQQFARVHSGTEYWVAAIGSWPGLPFMMALDPRCRLTAPKYNPPRTFTPKGTIGMGGSSTAIYSVESPGGYQIFARTPVPIWSEGRPSRRFTDELVLLRPSDRVKFIPIDVDEYRAIEARVTEGRYFDQIVDYQTFSVAKYKLWTAKLDLSERF